MGGYLDTLHASPHLKTALLGWVTGTFAVQPSRLSLPMAAITVRGYLDGLSYPRGGPPVITQGMADVVRRHGGEVALGTEVSRILVDHGRVRGIQVRNASCEAAPEPVSDVHAPAVVAAVDVKQTYLRLLPPDSVPSRVLRRVRNYELALPVAVVYLVLDRDLTAEGHPNAIHLAGDTDDLDGMYAALRAGDLPEASWGMTWIASLADPDNSRLCPPGQANVQLMGLVPAQHAWWGIAPGSGLTPRYDARKRQIRDQLVRSAERAIPRLGASIVYEETMTPITYERLMRTTDGTSHGPAFTPRQALTRLGATGAVKGLFHAGAGVRPVHGLAGTLYSGVAAASAVTTIPVAELLASTTTAEAVSSAPGARAPRTL